MTKTYSNPVYSRACPDPYVLKYCGEYWAYCTGFWHDGRAFGILRSRDLVHWSEVGGAMEPLPRGATCYWAPEVSYDNGRFLMYYSVGDEVNMEIRVAVARVPSGPFVDSGHRLTSEQFAIDPHVFEDDDRTKYCFYATDFLDHTHIGTGIVVDRMLDPFRLAGSPRPVTRARYDWQIYDPKRAEKGDVRWHTVEGPFVLKRKGRYFEMFSAGNWQNLTYGVAYATTDTLGTTSEWDQIVDGVCLMPILRTIPGSVIGPGHNSVVRGPDNLQLYCVYHRWAEDIGERVLAIDRQDWVGDRLIVLGPSTAPQPIPEPPTHSGFGGLGGNREDTGVWDNDGHWTVRAGTAIQESTETSASARLLLGPVPFVFEVSARSASVGGDGAAFGVALLFDGGEQMWIAIEPGRREVTIRTRGGDDIGNGALRPDFDADAYHLFRIEATGALVAVSLDGAAFLWRGRVEYSVTGVALVTERMAAEFAGFELTVGWEDLFTSNQAPEALGWSADCQQDAWRAEPGRLVYTGGDRASVLVKGPGLESFELVLNAGPLSASHSTTRYGIALVTPQGTLGFTGTIERTAEGWSFVCRTASEEILPLPADFEPSDLKHLRFRREGGRLAIQLESVPLGDIGLPAGPFRVGILAEGGPVAVEAVRVTTISPREASVL